jgi:aminopeptidase-like protein
MKTNQLLFLKKMLRKIDNCHTLIYNSCIFIENKWGFCIHQDMEGILDEESDYPGYCGGDGT